MVSSAAAGLLLEYLRDKNDVITGKSLNSEIIDEEIELEIKKAFKYVQTVLKQDYEILKAKRK